MKVFDLMVGLAMLLALISRYAQAGYETCLSSAADVLMIYGSSWESAGDGAGGMRIQDLANYYRDHGLPRLALLRDKETTEDQLKGRTLFLLGSPSDNIIIRRIESHLPVRILADGFEFGGKRYDSAHGFAECQPSPFDPKRWMVLHLGPTHAGMMTTFSVPISGPDYVVTSQERIHRRGHFIIGAHGEPAGLMDDEDLDARAARYNAAIVSRSSKHFVFHYTPGSPAEKEIDWLSSKEEEFYAALREYFGTTDFSKSIQYYFYSNLDEKKAVTGNPANAHNDPPTLSVHAVLSPELNAAGGHELAHLFAASAWGDPGTRVMGEGLAVWFDGDWWGKPLQFWGAKAWKDRQVPSLHEFSENSGAYWSSHEDDGYPLAGDFYRFLAGRYDKSQMSKLYVSKLTDSELRVIIGKSLQSLEDDWHAELKREALEAVP